MEQLIALIESLPPDVQEKLLGDLTNLGMVPETQNVAALKLARAEGLRQTPSPRGYSVGGTFIAANPLEHMGAAFQRAMGEKEWRGGMGEMQNLLGQSRTGLGQILRLWKNRKRATAAPPPSDELPLEIPEEIVSPPREM